MVAELSAVSAAEGPSDLNTTPAGLGISEFESETVSMVPEARERVDAVREARSQ